MRTKCASWNLESIEIAVLCPTGYFAGVVTVVAVVSVAAFENVSYGEAAGVASVEPVLISESVVEVVGLTVWVVAEVERKEMVGEVAVVVGACESASCERGAVVVVDGFV